MFKLVYTVVVAVLLLEQHNTPPVVKITSPTPSSAYKWNSSVRYSVKVSDKEDGDTRYDEIPAREVLIETVVTQDTNAVAADPRTREGVHAMLASNCMNCHDFNSKLIGPSFREISERYKNNKSVSGELIGRVQNGSKGKWGDIVMPSHPELAAEETEKMVQWILAFRADERNYYTGVEGAISLRSQQGKAYIVLTASYMDRGKATAQDRVVLRVED